MGDTGADYLIQRTGTNHKPIAVHIDEIRKLERNDHQEIEADNALKAARKNAKTWEVDRVVGERGATQRTKQWKLLWKDGTTSCEPRENCNNCAAHVKEWTEINTKIQRAIMMMTDDEIKTHFEKEKGKAINTMSDKVITSITPRAATLEEPTVVVEVSTTTDINLIQDISKLPKGGMIQGICDKLGIDIRRVRCVCASPPCETLSHADASNISRGNYYRDHKDATKPPRSMESCIKQADFDKRNKAIRDDKMIQNLIESMCVDRSRKVK